MTEEERVRRARMIESKNKRIRQLRSRIILCAAIVLVLLLGIAVLIGKSKKAEKTVAEDVSVTDEKYIAERPELDVELLPVNKYSRPGTALSEVNGIVIHYTANPGTTALQNREYFAGLAETGETSASSHFIIGLEGEIVQCVPCKEIAYASNDRNKDTISIECCIPDETGRFNESTYRSLVELTTWLMGRYDLGVEDVIRHYDVTGKNCPKYFVEHEEAWDDFHNDLADYIAENGIDKE